MTKNRYVGGGFRGSKYLIHIFCMSYLYKTLYFEFEQNPLINKSDITNFPSRVGERGAEASNGIVYNIYVFLIIRKAYILNLNKIL